LRRILTQTSGAAKTCGTSTQKELDFIRVKPGERILRVRRSVPNQMVYRVASRRRLETLRPSSRRFLGAHESSEKPALLYLIIHSTKKMGQVPRVDNRKSNSGHKGKERGSHQTLISDSLQNQQNQSMRESPNVHKITTFQLEEQL
ncbi:hypothetical protein F1880_008479, partial [Penicillium rolfsii]